MDPLYPGLPGHDPSQRAQILDSRNLAPSDFNAPNWLEENGADTGYGSYGSKPLSNVPMYAGSKYVLYDDKTHKVLGTATTADEIKALLGTINNTLVPQGKNASWKLYDMGGAKPDLGMHFGTPGPKGSAQQINGEWGVPIAGDAPDRTLHDIVSGLTVPAAAAVLMSMPYLFPALQGAAGGAAGGLGSITGTTAANVAEASLAGSLPGVLPSTAIPGIAGSAGTLGTTLSALAPEIVVNGLVGGGLGLTAPEIAALSAGLGGSVATGFSSAGGSSAGSSSAGSSSAGSSSGAGANEIVVNAIKPPPFTVPPVVPPVIPPQGMPSVPPANPPPPEPPADEIVVKGKPPVTALPELPPFVPPVIPPQGMPNVPPSTPPGKPIFSTTDYLRLGAGLLGGLAGGAGGGSKGGTGHYSGGVGSIFTDPLPPPSFPGGGATISPREMPEQNWYEYGYHPEQSFFSTSGPGYTPKPGKTPGMARGGEFAVRGPGTGRSDSIPANLSDGEYVVDAETVALLGDGSTKAGAQKLDRFRVNVRKHKGRDLAKGRFSVKAKAPEAYLAGGRT